MDCVTSPESNYVGYGRGLVYTFVAITCPPNRRIPVTGLAGDRGGGGLGIVVDSESRSVTGANRGFFPSSVYCAWPRFINHALTFFTGVRDIGDRARVRRASFDPIVFFFLSFFRGFISLCAFAIRACSSRVSIAFRNRFSRVRIKGKLFEICVKYYYYYYLS